jgi:hypothetical protein
MGKAPAFDMMLGIMVGSIVSRAITGNAPLVPALAATATLIALHSVLTAFADRWHGLGEMIKGRPPTRHRLRGHKDEAAMRIAEPTNRDLRDDLRHHGMTSSAYPLQMAPNLSNRPGWRGKLIHVAASLRTIATAAPKSFATLPGRIPALTAARIMFALAGGISPISAAL